MKCKIVYLKDYGELNESLDFFDLDSLNLLIFCSFKINSINFSKEISNPIYIYDLENRLSLKFNNVYFVNVKYDLDNEITIFLFSNSQINKSILNFEEENKAIIYDIITIRDQINELLRQQFKFKHSLFKSSDKIVKDLLSYPKTVEEFNYYTQVLSNFVDNLRIGEVINYIDKIDMNNYNVIKRNLINEIKSSEKSFSIKIMNLFFKLTLDTSMDFLAHSMLIRNLRNQYPTHIKTKFPEISEFKSLRLNWPISDTNVMDSSRKILKIYYFEISIIFKHLLTKSAN